MPLVIFSRTLEIFLPNVFDMPERLNLFYLENAVSENVYVEQLSKWSKEGVP